MTIQQKEHYTELTADEGKFLTQVNIENENERIFVLIACTANPSNWAEWTATQKGIWEAEHNTDEQSESNDV